MTTEAIKQRARFDRSEPTPNGRVVRGLGVSVPGFLYDVLLSVETPTGRWLTLRRHGHPRLSAFRARADQVETASAP